MITWRIDLSELSHSHWMRAGHSARTTGGLCPFSWQNITAHHGHLLDLFLDAEEKMRQKWKVTGQSRAKCYQTKKVQIPHHFLHADHIWVYPHAFIVILYLLLCASYFYIHLFFNTCFTLLWSHLVLPCSILLEWWCCARKYIHFGWGWITWRSESR